MKVVIQRVSTARVTIQGNIKSEIADGLLILLGVSTEDEKADADWLVNKVANLRIFNDAEGVMNESIIDKGHSALVISQFTLYASTKKGNRPSYIKAARPDKAIPLYEYFVAKLSLLGVKVLTGEFGADMKVALVNDGPVTIIIDTHQKV